MKVSDIGPSELIGVEDIFDHFALRRLTVQAIQDSKFLYLSREDLVNKIKDEETVRYLKKY